MTAITKKLNPWLEHVKAYKLDHPEVNLKSVLTEARKTYKTVKTTKQETRTKATETRKNAPKVTKSKKNTRRNIPADPNNKENHLLKLLKQESDRIEEESDIIDALPTKNPEGVRSKATKKKKTRTQKKTEDYTEDEEDSTDI